MLTNSVPFNFSNEERTDGLSSASQSILNSLNGFDLKSITSTHIKSTMSNRISIHFNEGNNLVIRPNKIIRGLIKLNIIKPILSSQIKIKFRAEEIGTIKIRESSLENKFERIDQVITTYFQVDTKVWGVGSSPFSISPWEQIEIGEYEYPFALKFPNVNFPPSTDSPVGFSISYIFSAHLEGAGFNTGLNSKDYIVPYRPIVCAPPPKEWSLNQIIYTTDQKKLPIANINITLPQHTFCPDEDVNLNLKINHIPENYKLLEIEYGLIKHSVGKLRLQGGMGYKRNVKRILGGISYNDSIQFHVPTRLVSPSFESRHMRVSYQLKLTFRFSQVNTRSKQSSLTADCLVPIGITNLPYAHLLYIPHLTSIQSYLNSTLSPAFFDPSLQGPPDLEFTPDAPPEYDTLATPFIQKPRKEHTVFNSRLIRPGMAPELGEPVSLEPFF